MTPVTREWVMTAEDDWRTVCREIKVRRDPSYVRLRQGCRGHIIAETMSKSTSCNAGICSPIVGVKGDNRWLLIWNWCKSAFRPLRDP